MKLNQDSITVNMVVKVTSDKYAYPDTKETSIEKIQELIDSGNFEAQYIPASFTSTSTGTLIIEEKA